MLKKAFKFLLRMEIILSILLMAVIVAEGTVLSKKSTLQRRLHYASLKSPYRITVNARADALINDVEARILNDTTIQRRIRKTQSEVAVRTALNRFGYAVSVVQNNTRHR